MPTAARLLRLLCSASLLCALCATAVRGDGTGPAAAAAASVAGPLARPAQPHHAPVAAPDVAGIRGGPKPDSSIMPTRFPARAACSIMRVTRMDKLCT